MKRENKKALTATRVANRAQTIVNLETCVATLRRELADALKSIDKLTAEVAALTKAQS